MVTEPYSIHIYRAQDSNFSTPLPSLASFSFFLFFFVIFFNRSHPNGYEVISHRGFDLHFPHDYDVEHLFMYLLAIVCVFWRRVYSGPLPIFKLRYLGFCY